MTYNVEHCFMFTCHLYIFFGEVSAQTFAHFLIKLSIFLLLSVGSSLCILDNSPSPDMSFANIFSHSLGCLFVLFMVSFAVQKLLSLIRSHLAFLSVCSYFHYSRRRLEEDIAVIYVKECFSYVFP